MIGEHLRIHEEWDNSVFLNNVVMDVVESTRFYYFGSDIETIIRSCSAPLRNELGYLSKSMDTKNTISKQERLPESGSIHHRRFRRRNPN